MPLQTLDYTTLLRNQIAAVQASSSSLLDFNTGSVLLALLEANTAAVGLWLQGLDIYILALTRAATSTGADLDSYFADFGFYRLAATYALGTVTFSRANTSNQAVIPVGAIVETAGNTLQYTVILDTTNANYNANYNGYVLLPNTSSINVTVEANTAGTIGNAAANSIIIISSPINYVDSVTNASSFVNASNTETDAAFRARFILFLAGISKATKSALGYAISQVQGVVDYSLTENVTYGGVSQLGYFYAVVDDGTGNPPSSLLSNVNNAIDLVRGLCTSFSVYAPVVITANIAMTITAAPGYIHSNLVTIVTNALTAYINGLTLGETLYYSRLAQIAYDSSPGVLNVTSVLINTGTSDLTITAQQVAKIGTCSIG